MTKEQQIRELLGPADPTRGQTIPPPAATAMQVIARAQATAAATRRVWLPRRRLVLAGGAAVAAAVTGSVLSKVATTDGPAVTPPDPPSMGRVLVPVGYEIDTNPQPAAARLRTLAAQLTVAPYDTKTGRYAYRHGKSWSSETLTSEEGFAMGYVEEEQMWTAPDGSGRIRRKMLAAQYPNEESRRYWERAIARGSHPPIPNESVEDVPKGGMPPVPPTPGSPVPTTEPTSPVDHTRPPTTPAELASLLRADQGAAHAPKWTMELYRSYVVPRDIRAQVLRILASLDGFVWRGEATDRAGRRGVAISVTFTPPPDNTDRNRYEELLIFNPRTGELLALEMTLLTPRRQPISYHLILGSDRTNRLG